MLDDCGLRALGASAPRSMTVPGVFVHAAAAQAVAGGALTAVAPLPAIGLVAAAGALVGSLLGFALRPWTAALAVVAAGLAIWSAEVLGLAGDLWLPTALPLAWLGASAVIAVATRYVVEERRRRRVQHAFSHYLSPYIVDNLAESEFDLRLGGEERDVTVMFADLSGFTAASGMLSPDVLMHETNRYLALIVDEVEATGGYVDKFIGDAVMAIWGAPVVEPQHAIKAVTTALRAAERVWREKEKAEASGDLGFGVKVGLCSGPALVGNVGTQSRYNYTAVGETVNIASRLEGLPGAYAGNVVLSEATARLLGDAFLLYELDRVLVKGLGQPISVFEPLAQAGEVTAAEHDYAAGYGEALALYRARDFEGARAAWLALDCPYRPHPPAGSGWQRERSHPARVMAARAESLTRAPPPQSWDGVWEMTSK